MKTITTKDDMAIFIVNTAVQLSKIDENDRSFERNVGRVRLAFSATCAALDGNGTCDLTRDEIAFVLGAIDAMPVSSPDLETARNKLIAQRADML